MRQLKSQTHRNRGAHLERMLDMTHRQYRANGIADIRKIPTPVKITSNDRGRITGYTQRGELVDYFGIFDGRPIIFDAKQTNERTRFPLDNIADHQYNILESWHQKGAHAFLVVRFDKLDEQYVLPFELLREAWTGYKGDGRKSIPYETFLTEC